MGNSLGFIEVVGMLGAMEACDAAVKSANVELVGCELTKGGGMVTITLKGNIGAVKAAVDAAIASVERVTQVVSHTVIARPSKELEKITQSELIQPEKKEEKKEPEKKNKKEITKEKVLVGEKKVVETKVSPIKILAEKLPVGKAKIEEKKEMTKTTVTKIPVKKVKKNKN